MESYEKTDIYFKLNNLVSQQCAGLCKCAADAGRGYCSGMRGIAEAGLGGGTIVVI